ncbi:MAG: hypothetical protein GF383_02970 [Candidatus Lokiarchaeota archaeon]|nr:hypothetical protein [Candidatus Lokiarchaeota archaeon]
MEEKEFVATEHLSLRFEHGKTDIYIGGERFMQCKYLLFINPHLDPNQWEIDSIDEAKELLNSDMEGRTLKRNDFSITPEQEFWAHCSNIQVWVEHDYDTRLLHSNLAFPLLRALLEVGDKKAKRVFLDEIGKRLESAYPPVVEFLQEEGFLDFLSREDFYRTILKSEEEVEYMLLLEKMVGEPLQYQAKLHEETWRSFSMENGRITALNLAEMPLRTIPEGIGVFEKLSVLYLGACKLESLPSDFDRLESLTFLELSANFLTEFPKAVCKFTRLERLEIYENKISTIPECFGNLRRLKFLDFGNNELRSLPESFGKLVSLEYADFVNNYLCTIPNSMGELTSLKRLDIRRNNLRDIPESLLKLRNLKRFDTTYNENISKGAKALICKLKEKGVRA